MDLEMPLDDECSRNHSSPSVWVYGATAILVGVSMKEGLSTSWLSRSKEKMRGDLGSQISSSRACHKLRTQIMP